MVKLKKLDVWSMAKLNAIVMAFFGLLLGLLFAGMSAFLGPLTGAFNIGGGMIGGWGFLSIVIFPVMYGVMGLVGGAVGALVYNLAAKIVGGIEMEFEQ